MARWTPRPTVSCPWWTSWGLGETTMLALCSSTMAGSSVAMRRVAWARSAFRSSVSGGSKKTGTKPARADASSASARRLACWSSKPRLAMTLTTVQPRSCRWSSEAGQPTASSSGWGATWTTTGLIGAGYAPLTTAGSARCPTRWRRPPARRPRLRRRSGPTRRRRHAPPRRRGGSRAPGSARRRRRGRLW